MPSPVWADTSGDLEMPLTWGQSTDDFDAQANIRYDVYVNGRYEDVVFGSGGRGPPQTTDVASDCVCILRWTPKRTPN